MSDLSTMTVEELVKQARFLQVALDAVFAAVKAQGVWMTADLQIIPVQKLDDKHLVNILNTLRKRYAYRAQEKITEVNLALQKLKRLKDIRACQMANMDLLNAGSDAWKVLILTDPIYPHLYREALQRNLLPSFFPKPAAPEEQPEATDNDFTDELVDPHILLA